MTYGHTYQCHGRRLSLRNWRKPLQARLAVVLLLFGPSLLAGCGAASNYTPGRALTANGSSAGSVQGAQLMNGTTRLAKATKLNRAAHPPNNSAYEIGPQDVLDISVFKVPELSKSVQVADTGTINLPLLGEVVADGRTARQLERELTAQLGAKYLQNPQVTVYVKEFNSRRVTVEGEVKRPGVYPLKRQTSLLQIIAMAQGLDEKSDSTVVVFRTTNGKRSVARFDIAAIRSGEAGDPEVQSGDIVVAGKSALKETFDNVLKALPLTGLFALL